MNRFSLYLIYTILAIFAAPAAFAAPANDNKVSATPLPGAAFVFKDNQNNIDATVEVGESTAPFNRRRNTVWYSWSPPATGNYVFEITDTDFDTIVGVLPGDSFNYNQRSASRLVFAATTGQNYQLFVGGFFGELNEKGHFTFAITPAPLSRAELISATLSPDPVASPGTCTVNLSISSENGFSDGVVNTQTSAGRLLNSIYFDSTQRTAGDALSGTYAVTIPIPANLPAQDLVLEYVVNSIDGYEAVYGAGYFGSQPIPALVNTTLTVTNAGTTDTTAPLVSSVSASTASVDINGNKDITFTLAVTDNLSGFRDGSLVVLNTSALASSSYYGSRIAAEYEFSGITSGTPLNGTVTTTANFDLPVGTYFVYVTLNDAVANRRTLNAASLPGPFAGTITVTNPGAPANDLYANATTLSGTSFTTTGNNTGASLEFGESDQTSVASVWYKWQAPTTGTMQIDTFGSTFDTVLAVFLGADTLTSQLVASNDDANDLQSRIQMGVTAGTIYYIAVGSVDDSESGPFTLNGAYVSPTSPVLTSISLSPTVADVSSEAAFISVDLGFTAPNTLSGVVIDAYDYLGNHVTSSSAGADLTSGTVNVALVIPAGTPPLPLHLETRLYDQSNNETLYGTNHSAYPSAFSGMLPVLNTGTVDRENPWIVSHSISPASVDVSTSEQTVTVTFQVGDDTGIAGATVYIYDQNGNDVTSAFAEESIASSGRNETYEVELTIPAFSAAGANWEYEIEVFDSLQKYAYETGTFEVVSTELAPPLITSISVTPNPVTLNGLASVNQQLDVAFTDDGSGTSTLNVVIRDAGGQIVATKDLNASDITSGNALNGTFQTTFPLPGASPSGLYSVSYTVSDVAGQQATIPSAATFQVNNTEVAAPIVTAVNTFPSATVTVDGMSPASPLIRLDFTDDGSGITFLRAEIQNASGVVIDTKTFTAADIAAGGSPISGYFETTFTIPGLTPSGQYDVVTDTRDVAGRERNDITSGTLQITNTDISAPVIDGFTVIPAHVFFDGINSNDAQLEIAFSDDGSGIDELQIEIRDNNGVTADTILLTALDITTGTSTSGTFLMTFTVPGNTTPGTFTIHANVKDNMGRISNGIAVGSFPVSIEAAPQITGFTVTPSPVDVNDATTDATLDIDFTDDNSGLTTLQAVITAPSGATVATVNLTVADIISGDAMAGRIRATFQLGKFAPVGNYTIKATVRDASGVQANNVTVGTFPVTNSGAASNALNVLTSLSAAPVPLNVTTAAGILNVTAGLSANAGIQSVRAHLYRPDGSFFVTGDLLNTPETPLSYKKGFSFTKFTVPGTWRIEIEIEDGNGNSLLYSDTMQIEELYASQQLPISGIPLVVPTFSITNTGTVDDDDPILSGLWFAPGTVDTQFASKDVRVNLAWNDAISGFDRAEIKAYSPNDSFVASTTITLSDMVLGDSNLGAAARTLTIPQGTQPGELRFELSLYDFAGNLSFFDGTFPPGSFQGLTVVFLSNFESWLEKFPTLTDTSPDGDPDHDGLSTFLEFLLDLDPTNSNDPGAPRLRIESGNLQLVYQPGPDSASVLANGYSIDGQISGDLIIWSPAPVQDLGDGYFGISIPLGAETQRFLRLIGRESQEPS